MLAWQRSEALECVKFRSMGTEVVVLLPPNHQRDAGRVRSLFEAWDARFSRFDPSSELSRVNGRAGHAVRVSPVMLEAVRVAVRAAHATNGTFDPLLGARMIELGYDRTFATIDPRPRPASGWVPGRWEAIEIDQPAGSLRIPQRTALDLGGIAKGMAVDAAIADLRGAGIAYAGVNAGGDLAVHGTPPGKSDWPVVIEGAGERMALLSHGALATSSVLDRAWHSGTEARHHLLDPRDGLPADTGVVLATVAAPTCAQAEVAAKAALLRGPIGGTKFLATHGLDGVLVARDGSTTRVGALTAA